VIPITPSQIMLLYTWFPLAAVIAILLLIGRFYQQFSGERTFYLAFLVPLGLFALALVRNASVDLIAGDPLADLLGAIAGLTLLGLSFFLYHVMTKGRSEAVEK
jgi:hypothetical protein